MPSSSSMLVSGQHLRPLGPQPSAAELLTCALLYSNCPTVVQIAEYLNANTDLDEPARTGYRAVVELARRDIAPSPELVLDELRRKGSLDRPTACWIAAATAGAPPEAARRYAAIVVSNSLRRQIKSWGTALVTAADTASECELKATIDSFAPAISYTFGRLAMRRGIGDE